MFRSVALDPQASMTSHARGKGGLENNKGYGSEEVPTSTRYLSRSMVLSIAIIIVQMVGFLDYVRLNVPWHATETLFSNEQIQGDDSAQILEGYFTPFNLLDCSSGFQCGIDDQFIVHCWINDVIPDDSIVSGLKNESFTSSDAGFVTVSCSSTTCCGVDSQKIECSTCCKFCIDCCCYL